QVAPRVSASTSAAKVGLGVHPGPCWSASSSTKGAPRRAASERASVDLPDPEMPTTRTRCIDARLVARSSTVVLRAARALSASLQAELHGPQHAHANRRAVLAGRREAERVGRSHARTARRRDEHRRVNDHRDAERQGAQAEGSGAEHGSNELWYGCLGEKVSAIDAGLS